MCNNFPHGYFFIYIQICGIIIIKNLNFGFIINNFFGGNMETIQYGNNRRELCRSTAGYILGLVASTLSFIVCFVTGILVFAFDGLIESIFGGLWDEFYEDIFMFDIFVGFEKFFTGVLEAGIIFFWIIVIGFVLGLIGTLISWRKATILSSSIMIIGGVFSLFSLIFPGVFLIIGGVLNIKCARLNSKSNVE